MFTHLRVHSSFSFLRGLASPEQLVQSAVQNGMDALALTDHHGMTGAIEFYDACRRAGIRPILGLEVTVASPSDFQLAGTGVRAGLLTLLAIDSIGWRCLCRLSSLLDSDEA